MDELKNKTMEVINNINNDWKVSMEKVQKHLNDVKTKEEGLDLASLMGMFAHASNEMLGNYSAHLTKLDGYFRDCQARNIKVKKGGLFN